MNDTDNEAVLRDVFERMARGDVAAMSEAMADEAGWTFPGVWRWAGTWSPKSVALDELLRPLMKQFVTYSSRADSILSAGEFVVVRAHATATTVRGDDYPQFYCYLFRMRQGKILEVIEYCDTDLVERVLEPPARPPSRPPEASGVQRRGVPS